MTSSATTCAIASVSSWQTAGGGGQGAFFGWLCPGSDGRSCCGVVPETEEAYQQKKNQLSELATLLHEAIIGTRSW